MKTTPKTTPKNSEFSGLCAAELLTVIEGFQQKIQQRDKRILLLEELLRLRLVQKFSASSEKVVEQLGLFDESELEVQIDTLREALPDDVLESEKETEGTPKKSRSRAFSGKLVRERIELCLSESEKVGANKTFFAKTKEELKLISAQLVVLEYWQEKAVFAQEDGSERIVAAPKPIHPLGKCIATVSLLSWIITSKYADGLPLYRLEQLTNRLGHDISRTTMAQWIIRLDEVFSPLIALLRKTQNSGNYLQADETRIQVLKEDGKTAQSDKWMWVTRGGPPGQTSILFDYDPSRAGSVAVRLLDDFKGILQADGYSGYGQICAANGLTRIGCWDHARRKFVEATKAAPTANKDKPSKADVALSHIRQFYLIERKFQDLSETERHRARQELSLPRLNTLKLWLEANVNKVLKGSLTRKAMDYTLNQWPHLIAYCDRGDLYISNVLAENAIRPFAIGRKNWLFADTPQGARASATCYSLIETAKTNGLEPSAYIEHVLNRIAHADTQEKLERLLPWNVALTKGSETEARTE